MLRQILHQYVPPALVDRPKRGFAAPIGEWLRGPTREWAEHLLDETRLRQEGFFESRQIRKRWLEHLAQKRDWSPGLWHVLMFQSWLDEQGPMQVESERGTALVSEAGTIVERCERAAVQTTGQQREQCEQSGRFPEPNPPRQISGSRSRPSIGPELRNGPPRATAQAFVLKRAQAAAKVTFGVGLALLTMNLASLWIYDLPSAPNPMFGDVHQPGRRFRQRIEGNGSGVFTSNCVRRASLPATDRTPVLMVLGNSYTEATQVEDKDHFAYLLEQELRGTPVLAIGISGFSVADYIAGAATFKKLFRPDWVVIPVRAGDFAANAWNKNKGGGYAYFEMEKASSQPRDLETPLVSEIVSEPAGLLRVVTTPISQPGWLSTETRERFPFWDPLVNFAYLRKSDLKAWMQGHDRPWFHAEAEVSGVERRPEEAMGQYPLRDEMKLLAKAYEGRLTLLYLPNFDPKFPAKESEAEKTLEKLAKRQGVRFVSLREEFPALAEAGHAPYGFSNTRFNWGHWNRDGHKAAAEVLFEELQQLQAIGKIHTLMAYSGKPTDI
jgi:hypothetical protein